MAEARQFPVVFVAVLGISNRGSIPRSSPIPAPTISGATPMELNPAVITTREERGTPAIPLLAT
jgi:hypothetical protein